MKQNRFIWAKKQLETKNANCVFALDFAFDEKQSVKFDLTANGAYKLYIDSKLRLYGPARAAKGYCRMDKKRFTLSAGEHRVIAVVSAYNVATFSMVKDVPYFYCVVTAGKQCYTSDDFQCYDLKTRVKNVQRYSYQRGFSEYYKQDFDQKAYFKNLSLLGEPLETVAVKAPKILSRGVPYPKMERIKVTTPIEAGTLGYDESLPIWEDRAITQVGHFYEGYYASEQEECLAHTVSRFTYRKGVPKKTLSNAYALYGFERNLTGFFALDVEVEEDAEIYVTFDEILSGVEKTVDFKRLCCTNAVKWTLKKGKYQLETIEPYTLKYLQVNCRSGKITVKQVSVVPVENKASYGMGIEINDERIKNILRAAQNTVAQNSVDFLMDCPSRERAGWINDIYYSRDSVCLFTGDEKVLKATLENYALAEQLPELPENMVPMCYPADSIDGDYISTCALWYGIIACDYVSRANDNRLKRLVKPQMFGLMKHFSKYENEDGLLEDLGGAIFIEWSEANRMDFVKGVNYPCNMMYYNMLAKINQLWYSEEREQKCEKIKREIIRQSYNGEFFEDNRLRVDGVLQSFSHITEVCQYYAFFSGVADRETFPKLYEKLYNVFTPSRDRSKVYPNIDKANVIPGLMMRETMLLEYGAAEKALNETVSVFGGMAEETGTLWEKVLPDCSCNHGIAAYAGYVIVSALTGFVGYTNDRPIFREEYVGKDCRFFLPWKTGGVEIKVENGVRTIDERHD